LQRTLDHVGHNAPDIHDPDICDNTLRGILISHEKLLTNLEILDPAGKILCRGASENILPEAQLTKTAVGWWQKIQSNPAYLMDDLRDSAHGVPTIIGVSPLFDNKQPVGLVVGSLSIDTLSAIGEPMGSVSMWMIPSGSTPMALNIRQPGAEPSPYLFSLLSQQDEATSIQRSASGDYYAYASGTLADGHRLVIGRQSNSIHHKAKIVLLWRVAEIAAFALLGLLGMIVGSNVGIARPIKRLHREVENWQREVKFNTEPLRDAPKELHDLGESFRSATASLTERALQLRMATVQQELLMQEIHHRVKNNLQIVASLLNLQASRIRQPEAQAEFQSARDRVRALATLHRHLYSHGELNTINMRSFLTELCEQLFSAMGQQPGQKIQLEIEAPELQMSSDQAVPLALIVTETVSNALKYAFPANHSGKIMVKLVSEQDSVLLTIQDNGVGIGTKDPVDNERRAGIGIQLIKGFVRQLGATLEMQEDHGTRYEIAMKLQRARDVSMFVHNALARSGVEQA
jgi:two-component sensor histidine kinase